MRKKKVNKMDFRVSSYSSKRGFSTILYNNFKGTHTFKFNKYPYSISCQSHICTLNMKLEAGDGYFSIKVNLHIF